MCKAVRNVGCPPSLTVGHLPDGTVISDVDVKPVWVVIHSRELALLDNTVLLWEILLGKRSLIARVTNLLAQKIVCPLGRLVAVLGLKTGYYERHVGVWFEVDWLVL